MALARNDEGSAQRVGRRGAVPLTQVAQDFLDYGALVKGRPEAEGCRLEVRDWGYSAAACGLPPTDRARGGRLEGSLLAQRSQQTVQDLGSFHAQSGQFSMRGFGQEAQTAGQANLVLHFAGRAIGGV